MNQMSSTPSPSTQFQPGALVRLRSGGPVMTVRNKWAMEEHRGLTPSVCRWFNNNEVVDERFYDHELEAVQDSRWLDQPDGPGYWWLRCGDISLDLVRVDRLHADQEMKVTWHGEERWQYLSEIIGHKWCKAADEPPARP